METSLRKWKGWTEEEKKINTRGVRHRSAPHFMKFRETGTARSAIDDEQPAEQKGNHRSEATALQQGKALEQNELQLSAAVCFVFKVSYLQLV